MASAQSHNLRIHRRVYPIPETFEGILRIYLRESMEFIGIDKLKSYAIIMSQ